MIPKGKVKYFAPAILFLLLLIDGQLSMGAENLLDNIYYPGAHLLLLAYMVMVPYLSKRYVIISALVIGLIYDSYYVGVLGIYTVALIAAAMMMYTFRDVLETNLPTAFFGMVIFVTAFELIAVALQVIFRLSHVGFVVFVTRALGPTLLFNMLLFVLFYYLMKRFISVK